MLAGGIGKRFWPFVTDKSIFPILGEPLILRNMKRLVASGFSRFVLITNPRNDAAIKAIAIPGVRIETVIQAEPKGMADALLTAQALLHDHPILVLNAEDVVDEGLYEQIAKRVKEPEACVVGRKTSEYFDGGYLNVSQSRLVGIVEKPGKGKEPSDLVNLVFHYFPSADSFLTLLSRTKTSRDDAYERSLDAFAKEFPVSVVSYEGFWTPLKYPWQVLDITEFFLHHAIQPGRGKKVDVRNNVVIEGMVYLGNNVKIFENTKIVGPTYIGDNTIIGSNNIIRESSIGSGCVTGFSTDIARSYIGNDSWFHNNYIGDSVLEGNVSMGAGSVLANLRLDEGEIYSLVSGSRKATHRTKLGAMVGESVRIGVNTSVMPGIKIGTNSLVGAGLVLHSDVPDDSFCVAEPGFKMKKNTRPSPSHNRAFYKSKL